MLCVMSNIMEVCRYRPGNTCYFGLRKPEVASAELRLLNIVWPFRPIS